ncbi:unnamed protein product [Schistosoma margrebowiei]|uniref:Uncharacterized protein n=1 Tax=Schistosoma margrebowiei TaxID=48269 RepID=A0A183MLC1_9TREM|nr:unnamed protein product [Schistosoma margrebowiei]
MNIQKFQIKTVSLDTHPTPKSEKYPIVIIPGDGGCQAYSKLKNSTSPPFLVWIDLRSQLFDLLGLSLVYDPVTRKSRDPDSADVYFPGWGETWSIENLDSYRHSRTEYCGPMIESLRRDPFFVSNWTIRGAPFDFRKFNAYKLGFNDKLMHLIEETYQNGGNRSVVLLGHSLGAKYGMYFLKSMKKSWKNKYVKTFVSLSAPLGGSVKALKIEASGTLIYKMNFRQYLTYNFGVFLRSPLSFRPVQRTLPSLAFLLPDSRLWSPKEPLIITPTTNYSAHDYERFFHDVNYSIGEQMNIMMLDSKSIIDTFEKPSDIDEIYCIHGSNLSTTDKMVYSPGFPDQVPALIPGNGDGTVSLRSLEVCKRWPGIKYFILPGFSMVFQLFYLFIYLNT